MGRNGTSVARLLVHGRKDHFQRTFSDAFEALQDALLNQSIAERISLAVASASILEKQRHPVAYMLQKRSPTAKDSHIDMKFIPNIWKHRQLHNSALARRHDLLPFSRRRSQNNASVLKFLTHKKHELLLLLRLPDRDRERMSWLLFADQEALPQ